MKKLCIVLLLLFLMGCRTTEKVSMMVPYGSPQMSQLYLQNQKDVYDVDIVIGADPLVAAFGSKSHDVIFAPINLGAKLFNAKEEYFLLGVITWGNYYLVSESELDLFSDLDQKSIIIFGRNQVSDILVNYLIEEYQIDVTITYVDSLSTATAHALLNPNDIVLVAEPSYSLLKKTNNLLNSIDLQAAYRDVSLEDSFPQAGVFVHKNVSVETKERLKTDLVNSINLLSTQAFESAELARELKMELDIDVLMSSFLSSHIEFVSGVDSKASIHTFFNLIMEMNSELIGGMLPNDSFYVE